MDDSTGRNPSESGKNMREMKKSFKKHQNFSLMIDATNPIGSSGEDYKLNSGKQMLNDYNNRFNSIFLGTEANKVREEQEEDELSPTAIMSKILKIDQGQTFQTQPSPDLQNEELRLNFN